MKTHIPFELVSKYSPTGDQPEAIAKLIESIEAGNNYQTLQGITGSGKTFTMANVIQKTQKPTLILAHNKTLAAQLAQEFKEFFPHNAVHYFVSYYDYYQPEAYISKTDTYIEKESTINEEIDRLRHAATEHLLTRNDVIIVASVSCIYGIGSKESYLEATKLIKTGQEYNFDEFIEELIRMQYTRANSDFKPGMFQVMGDVIEIFPASSEHIYVLEFFGEYLDKMSLKEPWSNKSIEEFDEIIIFPAKHTVTSMERIKEIVPKIQEELTERVKFFEDNGEIVKAERIKTKTEYDIEMMLETGYVRGIENYSRYLDGREAGAPAMTLIDFFPDDFLTIVDESHITIPQINGMFGGDKARKDNLITHGFRLPSAYDNRPLRFAEFEDKTKPSVFVSATPGKYEIDHSPVMVEQLIRPTGLLDPLIDIEDMEFMVDSLLNHINNVVKKGERALITTITKKSSEDLTEFLANQGVKVTYLHSDVDTIDRLEVLKSLRTGEIDVIVGVNLLREGLDLPEVSFIGILDAEKQGFLRSETSLMQIIGRAARNANGRVVMYSHGKKISEAMEKSIATTAYRRGIQEAYNKKHNITPTTVISKIKDLGMSNGNSKKEAPKTKLSKYEKTQLLKRLELEMDIASANQDFEQAAALRDQILALK